VTSASLSDGYGRARLHRDTAADTG